MACVELPSSRPGGRCLSAGCCVSRLSPHHARSHPTLLNCSASNENSLRGMERVSLRFGGVGSIFERALMVLRKSWVGCGID